MGIRLPSSSTIKLLLVIALALMLSCVTAPGVRTTDVAELHYGDREEDVIEKLGQGNELIYFVLDGKRYSYRLYTTIYIHDVYALLFMKGELIAVHNKHLNFSTCLNIKKSPMWKQCLTELLSEMSFSEIGLDTYDFSEGIQAENSEQTERDVSRATTAAIAVTLSIPYPGFIPTVCIFSCGGCFVDPGAQSADYPNPCIDEFTSTIDQAVDIIYNSHTLESIKSKFSQITSQKHVSRKEVVEERNDNSSILYYSWNCALDTKETFDYLSVLIGSTNGNVQWAWFRYEDLPEYESHEYRSRQLLEKASQGDPDAQWELYKKLPTEENLVWLCRAADQGHTRALHQLGYLYYYGPDQSLDSVNYNLAKDIPKACMWFYLAWRGTNAELPAKEDNIFRLGPYEISDIAYLAETMSTLERLEAEKLFLTWKPGQCDRDFSTYFGKDYQNGFFGAELIEGRYLSNFCLEADKGSVSARETIGRIYQFGSYGINHDLPRAYMWFLLAADAYTPEDSKEPRCREMTVTQRTQANQYLDQWKPGQCEHDLD